MNVFRSIGVKAMISDVADDCDAIPRISPEQASTAPERNPSSG